ncbi:MAG: Lipoprotein signal peptidase [Hyphomicrobiaceae bacterium hypho_1]
MFYYLTLKQWLWGSFFRLSLAVAATLVSVDQLHKWWMLNRLGITESRLIEVNQFLNLVYVSNKGISFGMLQQGEIGQVFLALLSLIISIALMTWLARAGESYMMALAIGLIVGGAMGNAIDRLHLGGVADFFDFHAFGYHWPAFNIADMAIVIGSFFLIYNSITLARPKSNNGE